MGHYGPMVTRLDLGLWVAVGIGAPPVEIKVQNFDVEVRNLIFACKPTGLYHRIPTAIIVRRFAK